MFNDEKESLNRPAWTQYDLQSYNHKHIIGRIIKNFYIKLKGLSSHSKTILRRKIR